MRAVRFCLVRPVEKGLCVCFWASTYLKKYALYAQFCHGVWSLTPMASGITLGDTAAVVTVRLGSTANCARTQNARRRRIWVGIVGTVVLPRGWEIPGETGA
jgi:hypothetical protein